MSYGISFKDFSKRLDILSLAKVQIKKLAKDLKAKEVTTNLSTALDTTFYIVLEKGKYSLYDKEIQIEVIFDRGISIYGKNICDYKPVFMKTTQSNVLRIAMETKKMLRGIK